jgi:hypothetical protein
MEETDHSLLQTLAEPFHELSEALMGSSKRSVDVISQQRQIP